ncbi:MAG: ABC transporter permease [Alphaproteobacteria bacterium]|nr:ABC transporter permease [Alphaproteobacteria bacterium]
MAFTDSLRSEWLKTRRSLASALVIVGAGFTPAVVIGARLLHADRIAALSARPDFWPALWHNCWESMAIFFLPMGAILTAALVTQIEVRNNAWKQVHVLPLTPAVVFLSKLAVIVGLMAQFVALFVAGVYLAGALPALAAGTAIPPEFPLASFAHEAAFYFLDALPVVAIQYALGLRFKSFLVPVGAGFLAWVAALAALASKWGAMLPYAYTMYDFLKDDRHGKAAVPPFDIHAAAALWCAAALVVGFVLFVTKREKG